MKPLWFKILCQTSNCWILSIFPSITLKFWCRKSCHYALLNRWFLRCTSNILFCRKTEYKSSNRFWTFTSLIKRSVQSKKEGIMKFILVLSVLSLFVAAQGRQIRKCGNPISALCADGKSQSCGMAPFCMSRSVRLRQNTTGCCCAPKSDRNSKDGVVIGVKRPEGKKLYNLDRILSNLKHHWGHTKLYK